MLPSVLFVGAAFAAPPVQSGHTCAVLDAFNGVAMQPLLPLSPKHCEALDRGETVTLIQPHPDGHPRAIGLARTGLPKEHLWIASQDPHFSGEDIVIETPLQVRPHDSLWYGMLDIPKPFSDRHWVIHTTDNSALMKTSGGRFCEHPWTGVNERLPEVRAKVEAGAVAGLDVEHFDKAMATPVNEGALVFLDVGARDSLYLYHVTTDIGGMVPERMVAGYLRSTMGEHIRGIIERARTVIPRHYRGDHPLMHDCGNSKVPLFE